MRLTLAGISYSWNPRSRDLFNGVRGTFRSGDLTAVTGPSGSGKSTMLDILGGIRSPTQGVVLLEDELGRALSTAQHARSCAWILQSNLVLGRRTVLDNVTIGALAQGVPAREARDRARAALDLLGIAPHAQVPVDRLSGGEQQRVTVARCIASPSAVLLADEPTGSLDAFNTGLVVECLQRAAASNQIVFVATHDDAVKSGCARVLDLSEASE